MERATAHQYVPNLIAPPVGYALHVRALWTAHTPNYVFICNSQPLSLPLYEVSNRPRRTVLSQPDNTKICDYEEHMFWNVTPCSCLLYPCIGYLPPWRWRYMAVLNVGEFALPLTASHPRTEDHILREISGQPMAYHYQCYGQPCRLNLQINVMHWGWR
jgi:hypothetical protein